MQAKYGIRSLFATILCIASLIIVVQDFIRGSMYYLCITTLLLVLSDICFSRLKNELTSFQSGFRAVIHGMVWSGFCVAVASSIQVGPFEGASGFLLGMAIGFLIAIIPVSMIALIPGQKQRYLGERNLPKDKTVSTITAYIGGQGG